MTPYTKKIIKNIEAKVKPISIVVILILVSLTTMFIINPNLVDTVRGADYNDFLFNKKITISNTYIDTDLVNFPILVHDNTGDLVDILTNGSDIAFFDSTNTTQFNHEIEEYNSTTGELLVWVNVTSISSSVDTVFYMYYDDSDGGYPVGYNHFDVWDDDYIHVWHMNGTTGGSVYDSVTGSGSVSNNADSVTGKIGKGYQFTASNNDLISFGDLVQPADNIISTVTFEAWSKYPDVYNDETFLLSKYNGDNQDTRSYFFTVYEGAIRVQFLDYTSGLDYWGNLTDSVHFVNNSWGYMASVCNLTSETGDCFYNESEVASTKVYDVDSVLVVYDIATPETVGYENALASDYYMNAVIDEIRISKTLRNDSWVKASFHTSNQTTGFLTLGSESGVNVQLLGLTNSRVTWSGEAGDTIWCNSSGIGYETIEVNITITGSGINITEIRVWVGDMNNSGSTLYINASNITCYASSDNSSSNFGVPTHNPSGNGNGIFADGGCNITLNTTTWNAGTMGSNPFNITSTGSIYIRFKLAIPVGQSADEYYSISTTTWKVYTKEIS